MRVKSGHKLNEEKQMKSKRTAVITGGGRGIGFAICRQLSEDGFSVVVVSSSPVARYADNLNALSKQGADFIYVQADIANADDRQHIVDEAVAAFGGIHVLVNNAGVAPLERKDLLEMTEESFDRVVGINTKGNMFLTQLVAKRMISQEPIEGSRGTIVNISSCSAEVSSTSRGEYCVSKAGVAMLTMLYADRLAAEGIFFVHEVRLGVIDTDMTGAVRYKYDKLIADGVFPIARWGKPEDVANAVSALCSGKFSYTTGNYIDVDGGFHIRRL